MRIAQVAPPYESAPPKYYGETERVMSYLTEELVRQGHDITLFASGDSETKALLAACRRSLRLDKRYQGQMAHHFVILERVFQRAGEQHSTATRMAHGRRQQFERLIARNQEVSEAA
jgi:hypothetical protein